MKKFDFYEFTGILVPGVILLYALSLRFPEVTPFMSSQQLSVGDLGLFIVLSYVSGHLVQSVGNFVEWVFWKPFGGMPTNWVIAGRTPGYLNPQQVEALPSKVEQILGGPAAGAMLEIVPGVLVPNICRFYEETLVHLPRRPRAPGDRASP